jgi:hypothetical protein
MAQKAPKDTKPPRDVGPLGTIAGHLLWVALPVAGCTALYLVYNFYASGLGFFPFGPDGHRLTADQQAHIRQTVHITSLVLTLAGSLAALLAVLRYYDSDAAVFGAAAAGVVAYLGVPMLIRHQMSVIGKGPNPVTSELIWAFQAFGKVALLVVTVRVVVGVAVQLARRRPVRAEAAAKTPYVGTRPGMLGPCWELSKCREYLREVCPNSKDRKTCWRRKSGCGCDPQLARRLALAKDRYLGAVEAIEERAQAGAAAPEPTERRALLRHRQAMCRQCPIYLEHQEYKYRTLQWFMYPLAVVLIVLFWHWISIGYDQGLGFLEHVMAGLTMLPQEGEETIANQILGIDVKWLIVFCFGVILVTWLLRLLERWVFEWKW